MIKKKKRSLQTKWHFKVRQKLRYASGFEILLLLARFSSFFSFDQTLDWTQTVAESSCCAKEPTGTSSSWWKNQWESSVHCVLWRPAFGLFAAFTPKLIVPLCQNSTAEWWPASLQGKVSKKTTFISVNWSRFSLHFGSSSRRWRGSYCLFNQKPSVLQSSALKDRHLRTETRLQVWKKTSRLWSLSLSLYNVGSSFLAPPGSRSK